MDVSSGRSRIRCCSSAGSSNQRILDVPKSLAAGEPVIWAKLHDQERDIPEIYLKDREAGEGQQAS